MCGIIGKIGRWSPNRSLVDADLDPIRHRGPDDRGLYQDGKVSLGHVRLSIIDLSSAGHQPMHSPDGAYTIVYNGEVYNYLEVRDELRAAGVVFTTESDTEVVLKSYIHWGPACLARFRGMFAFAIWDKRGQKLFMARDRCGEKPFIYAMDSDHFYFSSEFKGLIPLLPEMPDLDRSSVDMYLHYQYMPEPQTLFEGVHKLPAAHYAVLDTQNWTLKIEKYWDLMKIPTDPSLTKHDIRDELEQAVQLCLRSDVPVGVALSAGIDSGGIAALAKKHHEAPLQAFCVGYPGRPAYDERAEAARLAQNLGCVFNEVELATEEFVNVFPDFSMVLDEPIADVAAYGHYAVPKSCANHGIKVLLTGIGGDEVFWGYDWARAAVSANQNRAALGLISSALAPLLNNIPLLYKVLFRLSRTRHIPQSYKALFRQLLAHVDYNGPRDQLIFMAASGAPEFTRQYQVGKGWYGPVMINMDPYNAYIPTQMEMRTDTEEDISIAIMDLLFKTWMTSNCLSLGDRVSMATSVETRLPLLDVRLIEKVVAYRRANPDHTLGQKTLLRDILSDALPPETVGRRKSGFVPPVTKWLSGIADAYAPSLDQGILSTQGIIKPESATYLRNPDSGVTPHTLYRLILLEQWVQGMTNLFHQRKEDYQKSHENRILFG